MRAQLEALEIQVEAQLIQEAARDHGEDISETKSFFWKELAAWRVLFTEQYRPRVLIGVIVMVFQRQSLIIPSSFKLNDKIDQNGLG
jgi:hypothetical protein